jgi:hypothetical protein
MPLTSSARSTIAAVWHDLGELVQLWKLDDA